MIWDYAVSSGLCLSEYILRVIIHYPSYPTEYNYVPFQIGTSLQGKDLLPEGANSFL